jgi:hypothetical protein
MTVWRNLGDYDASDAEIFLTGSAQFVPYKAMADYRLVLDGLAAFVVDIAATSGRRCTRRFPTEAAALTRIAEREFRAAAAVTVAVADSHRSSTSLFMSRSRSRTRSMTSPISSERQSAGSRTTPSVWSKIAMVCHHLHANNNSPCCN